MRILLVEDEETLAELLIQEYFVKNSIAYVWAKTLKEVVAVEGPVDVVLLDLNLPDSDGWNTLISARAKFPLETRIVVFTGGIPPGGIERAMELGADHVLLKPHVSPASFDVAVRVAMGRTRHPHLDDLKTAMEQVAATLDKLG